MLRLLACALAFALFVSPYSLYGIGLFTGDNGVEYPFLTHIEVLEKKKILLKDELDLSHKDLRNARISRYDAGNSLGIPLGELKDIKFDGANLDGAEFQGVLFINCSFKKATLRKIKVSPYDVGFTGCDFTDAVITDAIRPRFPGDIIGGPASDSIRLSTEHLKQTLSFKQKYLYDCNLFHYSLGDADMSCFNLRKATFGDISSTNVSKGCDLDNATITGVCFYKMSREQLTSTGEFKIGYLCDVRIMDGDLSGIDLSRTALLGCVFGNPRYVWGIGVPTCDFKNANFTNTVITRCDFSGTKNLTLEQIKSTWNYEVGRMDGIKLPPDIQKALDAEKKK